MSKVFKAGYVLIGLPRWCSGKESSCQCRRHKRLWFDPWVGKIPWKREWQPTPAFLPGKAHGQKSCWATVHGVTKSQMRLSMHTLNSDLFWG